VRAASSNFFRIAGCNDIFMAHLLAGIAQPLTMSSHSYINIFNRRKTALRAVKQDPDWPVISSAN
jgi:hypothetical protein